jgi:Spx/MgsR family transcriptional regulator
MTKRAAVTAVTIQAEEASNLLFSPHDTIMCYKKSTIAHDSFITTEKINHPMKIYGILNCDTVKKALTWLKANDIDFEFHDFKKEGISAKKLKEWDKKAGLEKILNKNSSTWKEVDAAEKAVITSIESAVPLLQEKTSIIKRPVIEDGKFLFFGFDEQIYRKHFVNR